MKYTIDDFIEQFYEDNPPEPNDYFSMGNPFEKCCLDCDSNYDGCWCDECACKECCWYDEGLTGMRPCTLVGDWREWKEEMIEIDELGG